MRTPQFPTEPPVGHSSTIMNRSQTFWRLFASLAGLMGLALLLCGLLVSYQIREASHRQPEAQLSHSSILFSDSFPGLLVIMLFLLMTALLVAWWMARGITHPILELSEASDRIAAGELGHKTYAHARDEMRGLIQRFNRMSENLHVQFQHLAEERAQLRMILGGMVEGVVAIDAEQRLLFANERAGQLLGFTMANAVGRKLWEVVRRRGLQDLVERALDAPNALSEELTWNHPRTRSLTVHAARLPGPPARGAVLVLHDTSELRRLERLRQEFVANVSHELKTPLAVIAACVETLIDGAVDDKDHRGPFLQQIADQSSRLHALILDLLSLARLESGEESLQLREVALEPFVDACLERHSTRAQARSQSLVKSVPNTSEPVTAWADEEAIDHILENLVDNALKYTPEQGKVQVSCWTEEDEAVLEVKDNGIGIPEHDLPRVFERFYRVDRARSRELGGTGLGLSIVKHLVQALQGRVEAWSQPGQGTSFQIRLPRRPIP